MDDSTDRRMAIATWAYIRAPDERRDARVTWEALAARLVAWRERPAEKQRLPVWSPTEYRDGYRGRGNAGVVSLSALVLDFDAGDVDAALARWVRYRMAWHTTWSSTAATLRARAIVPLAEPHPAEHWPAVWAWLRSLGVTADRACSDPARAYYVGCPGADGDWLAEVRDGPLLDVGHLRVAPPAPRPAVRPVRVASPWGTARAEGLHRARDPAWREAAGTRAGGRVESGVVRGVRCPACGRSEVWWPVEPEHTTRAMCSHKNSCGWTGRIEEVSDVG